MRIMGILLLAMFLVGCKPTTSRLPSRTSLAPPLDHMWPENTQKVTWIKMASRHPQWEWEVSVGNERIWVSSSEKKRSQEQLGDDVEAWRQQIQAWRSQRLHAYPWVYTSSISSLSPAQRSQAAPPLWVFVSPDCQLCDQWHQRWPKHIPVVWVPVSSTVEIAPLWFTQWCNPNASSDVDEKICRRTLNEQYQYLVSMGVDVTPVIVATDGRALEGWPDAAWLSQWWNPSYQHWLAPDVVQEPDM